MLNPYDTLIIGCGPCGIGSSLILKNAGKRIAIIEGSTPGGKVNITPRVDNYPGFDKVLGPSLAYSLYKRVLDNKIEVIPDKVISLTKEENIFKLKGENSTYFAKTVLVASGCREKKLGLEKEDELLGLGLSYCAVCDGHFFRKKEVIVIGGDEHAIKEAIYLSSLASKVTFIDSKIEINCSKKLLEEYLSKDNTNILNPYIIKEIIAEDIVKGVKLLNLKTNEEIVIPTNGIFPLIGVIPNTIFMNIDKVLDNNGFIPVNKNMETCIPGLYAGGDVLPRELRQIYLAELDGKKAANSIIEYLNKENEN